MPGRIREPLRRMRRRGPNEARIGSGKQHSLQLRTGRMQLCGAVRTGRVLSAMVRGIVRVAQVRAGGGRGKFGVCGVDRQPA